MYGLARLALLFMLLLPVAEADAMLPLAPAEMPLVDNQPVPDWPALTALYDRSNSTYLWHRNDGSPDVELIDALLRAVDMAAGQGLSAARYHDRRLLEEMDAARRDILLSDALLRVISDMGRGQPEAEMGSRLWHLDRPSIDPVQLAEQALIQRDPDRMVAALAPSSAQYRALVDLYQHYQLLTKEPPLPELPTDLLIKPDEQSDLIPLLRRYLVRLGDAQPDPLALETAPDLFDQSLQAALRRFQMRHGLEVDGVLGPKTVAELNRPLSQRIEQIRVNLERWRWMPRELGERYVLVSIPGFFLELVDSGQPVLELRTVTGRPRWPTPSFQTHIRLLTVNPSWIVPRSILRKELLPKIKADPSWLANNNMNVERYQDGRWQGVDATTVDWSSLEGLRLRERPGPANSLGRLKFGMDNPFAIYLHDTPAKSLFDKPLRSFSHGCVRVQGIETLAQQLMSDSTPMQSWFSEALEQEQTRNRSLPEPVPVYVVYLSAWVDTEGQAQFRPDVYGLDGQVQARLQRYGSVSSAGMIVNN
ncbi:hypothetical protein ADIMK_0630 [Marinobacterium lacunae]|uniref:L,D-TPase catalytic domain-containing protein n=1 Tax=Marinobacterium lacunae TaxID=1232683 RepID=A0A081G2C3_9GAMM|nr:L,D-transpeptidase family protein [Marinobacterium lacunae]KEA64928.1 hypothetical protein ADIMK_0630 [Marinobacterium lacunae]